MKGPFKNKAEFGNWLEDKYLLYNTPAFIEDDPVSIPHSFTKKQDIEIMGFWTAVLAWGQRQTIINKARQLVDLMDGAPHQFIVQHAEKDRARFLEFKHRTFQPLDTLYFLTFLQEFYQKHESLEEAFITGMEKDDEDITNALVHFHDQFFEHEYAPDRTRKHIATPARKSTCKRLNMFLRWMVRSDDKGVDFGIWKRISASQLCIPLDVHVERVAREVGLLKRKSRDWKAVQEITQQLRKFDATDPAKYDFALFGVSMYEKAPYR